jgi:glycosyltransferase involved in cell wall biosynthesis
LKTSRRLLIFSDWYTPGFKAGGPIRSLSNLVSALEHFIDIFIVTGNSDLNSSLPYDNIEADKWLNIGKSKIIYLSKSNKSVKKIKYLISELKPDVIYLNSMYSINFTVFPLLAVRFLNDNIKIVLAPRGMLQKGAIQNKNNKKKLFIFLFKLSGWNNKIVFHATDEQENIDIAEHFPLNKQISIIKNFVISPLLGERKKSKFPGCLSLVYISVISFKKNLSYLPVLFNKVKGDIMLDVYGPIKDKTYWESFLAKITAIKEIKFNYKGDIPNYLVKETLANYDFFILPTFGENFGHAIYEALSSGIPVILSDKTPWRKLEGIKAGWDIDLDKPEEFVKVLNKCVCMDEEEYNQWRLGAYNYAKKYYAENNLTEDCIKLFS